MTSYEERCTYAATNQGLDPIVEALTTAGIPNRVEQTGGFTMVVVVPKDDGNWAIVDDGAFLAGWFAENSWHDGSVDSVDHSVSSLEALVALVSKV